MINLFSNEPTKSKDETFQTLLQTRNIHIQKISSHGYHAHTWYEQKQDEWVVLLEGEASLLFEYEMNVSLKKGEHIFIPKGQKHQVTRTSSDALWLAVFFD